MTNKPGESGDGLAEFIKRYERKREKDREHLRKLYIWMIVAVIAAPVIGVIVDRKYFRVGVPPPVSRIVFAIDENRYTDDTRELTLTIGNAGSEASRGLEAWIQLPIGVRATAATGDPRVTVFVPDTNRWVALSPKRRTILSGPRVDLRIPEPFPPDLFTRLMIYAKGPSSGSSKCYVFDETGRGTLQDSVE